MLLEYATLAISAVIVFYCRPLQQLTQLLTSPMQQHLWFGASVAILALWSLRYSPSPALSIHFLGATTLTLMFGIRQAICCLLLTLILQNSLLESQWSDIGKQLIILAVIPALCTRFIQHYTERYLGKQLFVYIFCGGFISGGVAIAVASLLQVACYKFIFGNTLLGDDYISFIPLLIFPEALLNGMAITLMTVYKPAWLKTFDEKAILG